MKETHTSKVLQLEHVSYSYHNKDGETKALSDISFSISEGEFVAIVGPSGCGKSTLLSLIAGLLSPEMGSILVHGTTPDTYNTKVGYMLQRDHLLEWRTTFDNVALGLEIRHQLTKENLAKIDEMLARYDLLPFKHAYPKELSGGMRQRVALIRTLILQPSLLLLDEPFSALDYQTRLQVSNDICDIIRKEKKTALLITHDISEAISVAERIIILTARPATVKRIVPIKLTLSEKTTLSARSAPEFKDYFNYIWKELGAYETAH